MFLNRKEISRDETFFIEFGWYCFVAFEGTSPCYITCDSVARTLIKRASGVRREKVDSSRERLCLKPHLDDGKILRLPRFLTRSLYANLEIGNDDKTPLPRLYRLHTEDVSNALDQVTAGGIRQTDE